MLSTFNELTALPGVEINIYTHLIRWSGNEEKTFTVKIERDVEGETLQISRNGKVFEDVWNEAETAFRKRLNLAYTPAELQPNLLEARKNEEVVYHDAPADEPF